MENGQTYANNTSTYR